MEKSKAYKTILTLILSPCLLYGGSKQLIVLDVGQGSCAIIKLKKNCFIFDVGGEQNPIKYIQKICKDSSVRVFISHYDWDHYNYLQQVLARPNTCLDETSFKKASSRIKKILKNSKLCKKTLYSKFKIKTLHLGDKNKKHRNANSSVYLWNEKILIPGDSEKEQEKLWAKKIKTSPEILILGHHGSKTSTSQHLLRRLKPTTIGIASARKQKYGHPHKKAVSGLRAKKIPSLSTGDWGTIYVDIN